MNPQIQEVIQNFAKNPLFSDAEEDEMILGGSPYRRPTRNHDNDFIDYERPLRAEQQASNGALSAHRLLLNAYETDLFFLPAENYDGLSGDLRRFYGPKALAAAAAARPILERKAFSFLDEEVAITGRWTAGLLTAYFREFVEAESARSSEAYLAQPLLAEVAGHRDPPSAARHFMIQMASDFLSEASAMARYSMGAYGPLQSSLFTVQIDEYGAGVHARKHSTLFEDAMRSVGLDPRVHAYWQFYQPTSLALTNYFHYLGVNKALFFRYLGALFYTETSLVNTARQQSQLLKAVFGDRADTTYFDEHAHIDQHHGDMALHRLVAPALASFGDEVAPEILRGFEEFRYLQAAADRDLIAQLRWSGDLASHEAAAREFYRRVTSGEVQAPLETFVERKGERSTTHAHAEDRLLVIETGEMAFWPLYGEPIRFRAGDVTLIPKHRLHGSVVLSPECVYHQPFFSGELPSPAAAGAR